MNLDYRYMYAIIDIAGNQFKVAHKKGEGKVKNGHESETKNPHSHPFNIVPISSSIF